MNHTMETTAHPLDTALDKIATMMEAAGDMLNAERLLELRSKLSEGQLTVAFCGHFSAGKSTLVNRLCGTELLPSSPIPTSANVVSIMNGESKATIKKLVGGEEQTLEVPIADINKYCKDGETVLSVSLSYPIPRLGDHTVLLDTPGIDSTDDAHRMSTESALHMADAVFYVMDYNHVQSEINFTFAKQLKEWGKPLYLIVNQIDKHRDRELSFAEYRRSVEEAFANWHLEPSGIVYLSLREPNHPYSEWGKFEELLEKLSVLRTPLALCSVDASSRHLIRTHGKVMEDTSRQERERLLEAAGGEGGAEQVRAEIAGIEEKLAAGLAEVDGLRTRLRVEMQSLLDNANITPAPTRDLAQAFLESRKPGFKAGLLFAGAKTAAEQQRRLEAFRDDLAAQVKAGIEWHLNDLLRKAADAIGWRDESLERQLEADIHWEMEPEFLLSHVKAGAVFGNEYTINYCRELAADVKGLYRKRAMSWIDTLAQRAAAAGEAAAAPLRARLGELASQAAALAGLASLAEREAAHLARLAALLPPAPPRPALPQPQAAESAAAAEAGAAAHERSAAAEAAPVQERQADGTSALPGAGANAEHARTSQPPAGLVVDHSGENSALGPQREAAERLRRAAQLLAPHPALASTVTAMRDKADRLSRSRFTIALFGAFSAGKSSLANALLGDSVLPVSPNPTTAAVNRIVPPTDSRPSGTATVRMKSREAMLDDLRYSLQLLGEDMSRISEDGLLDVIEKLSPDNVHAGGRPHYSFLKAALKGWQEHEPLLGRQLDVDGAQYRRYVAEESRSCFVSEIELYHHNALTAQGIVLVDTPGADSVNARHTGVAFNYIKNADAILFVTYYNHAFSQADRQFLLQLGRVKDQFELDKMFFIVNAADLASSEEEKQGVLAHVERNLQQHEIRFPRMYAVSSMGALEGKQGGDLGMVEESGIAAFEASFIDFTRNDLGRLAVASAEQELDRARRTIEEWLDAASGDAATREEERTKLLADGDRARGLADVLQQQGNPQLEQELKELLFYVIQRVQFRFGDHYNFAFNPSSLQDDGRDLKKALWTSWLELQRLLQIELAQELEATSLRLDNAVNRLAAKRFTDTAEEAAAILSGFSPSEYNQMEIATPEQAEPWQASVVEAKWLWSRFKSPRHFFEGDGKAVLRGALEAELSEPIQSWIASVQQQWSSRYEQLWNETAQLSADQLRKDINAFAEGKLASLSGDADVAQLQQLHSALTSL
ncbi:dynamin family protein [Paenibacillus oenotherae]|uniref:Dynamin family protein n=1 Tax=Paenibacillus oenotherae TaxID=1435645 RepID=A0ABS7D2F5_9BACL|nr:dynamin family protein [Paenibacillus oenotherae]MBW7474124.1 dynamin family protein [Paenibacillus oenotherae]